MRNLLSLLVLLSALNLTAQNYYVTAVEGKVLQNNQPLTVKQKLDLDNELAFGDLESKAFVVSSKGGLFVLVPGEARVKRGSEFMLAVKQALIPPSQLKETATRANIDTSVVITLEDPYEMLAFFRGEIAYPGPLQFTLDPDEFGEEDGYFLLTATTPNGTITHRFQPEDGQLTLELPEKHPVETTVFTLTYEPLFSEEEDFEAESFTLRPVAEADLKQEVGYLRELSPEQALADFLNEVAIPFCELRYGKISAGYVRRLVGE